MFESEVFSGTDLELERRVTNYLAQRHVQALRLIRVACKNGTVILTGKVQSFYERQLCLSCCQRVAGVIQLVDEIEVAA
jgi:osmotically-inducible protein OsmY